MTIMKTPLDPGRITDPYLTLPAPPTTNTAKWANMIQNQVINQQGRAIAGDQYYLAVTKVVNGYVLQCGDETWVAKNEEELKNLFITAIVTKKMG